MLNDDIICLGRFIKFIRSHASNCQRDVFFFIFSGYLTKKN